MAGELILYTTTDGSTRVHLRVDGDTVWASQLELAELFQTSVPNINIHIANVLEEGELTASATIKEDLIVQLEGTRQVRRPVKMYNLDMILAIGYRVRSLRGTQFRQWATTSLREYLVKGFVMDDERLKDPGGWDYFDELLQRIRDIRASEKRFYQKVKDIYATAVDYDGNSESAKAFFQKVQNKMLWAVSGHTAPELLKERSDSSVANMGLTSFKGERVRKADVTVAKNYLQRPEVDALNRIVVMYLDYAESMAERRKVMTMAEWAEKLDAFLEFNERDVLTHGGKMRADVAERLALERFEEFDARRRMAERTFVEIHDTEELRRIEQRVKGAEESAKQ